jgi:hypothetical protein
MVRGKVATSVLLVTLNMLSRSLLSVAAALACLIFLGSGSAGDKQKKVNKSAFPKQEAKKHAPPKAGVSEELKFEETELLRKAYILLAGGNHDYDGHRVKAMGAVREGGKILDESIMKHGSQKLKAAVSRGRELTAAADLAAKKTPIMHERQAASDTQLVKAAEVLAELRPALAKNNQKVVLGHVDRAISEIKIALAIR